MIWLLIENGHHRERPILDWSQNLEREFMRDEAHRLPRQAIDEFRPLDKAAIVLSDLEALSQRETVAILQFLHQTIRHLST